MSQFTKRAIIQVFIELLNEVPLDKIRVKDIAQRCGINRNTFYYYYQDIYALLADVFSMEIDKVIGKKDDFYESWIEGFLNGISFARENKKAVFHIYNSLNCQQLEKYLYSVTEYIMGGYVKKEAEGMDVPEEDMEKITSFYKFAFVGLILQWLAGGMKDDIDSFILRIGVLLDGGIKTSLQKAALPQEN